MKTLHKAILLVVITATYSISAATYTAAAQVVIQVAPQQKSRERSVGGGSLFIPNRELTQQLKAARKLIGEKNYSDGLDLLQHILDKPEDYLYYEDPEKRTKIRSHKMEAMKLLAELPKAGKDEYELKFGTFARKKLNASVENGNIKEIESIARSYFHTKAGADATYLLGTYHFDRDNPLAAALHFRWLKRYPSVARQWEPMLTLKMAVCFGRAGMPEESLEALLDMKNQNPSGKIVLGGTIFELFEDDNQALEWLTQTLGSIEGFSSIGEERWTMFRGNPARNASSSRSSPVHDSLWQSPTILLPEDIYGEDLLDDDKDWKEKMIRANSTIQQIEKKSADENRLTFPSSHPLIVGDMVLFRTMRSITGVDKNTGETLWEVIPSGSEVFDKTNRKTTTTRRRTINGISSSNNPESYLSKRVWQDVTQGTLSTDGMFVYFIDETTYSKNNQRIGRVMVSTGDRYRTNKLKCAYVSSGLYGGEIGGEAGDNSLLLAGSFFLGPPLPIAGKLFVLAEIAGEITLVVLKIDYSNLKKPKFRLLWKQPLIHPRHTVNMLDLRKMAGSSPAFGEGVMICPTTAGSVVAIDLARRVILWGYRYPANYDNTNSSRAGFQRTYTINNDFDRERRWVDSAPTIVQGKVLLTPRDSNDLHCLNLLDGSVKWKKRRGDGLYLAGVVDEKVIVVGKRFVEAIHIETGNSVWKHRIEIPQPSGRGYRNGRYYHLPLSTNEIATIDLEQGRLIAKSTVRGKIAIGNLVSAGGMIVSQTKDMVMGFKPMETLMAEIAKALEKNPGDPEALSVRGEIKLHEGDIEGGMKDLRQAVAQKKIPRASRLIVSNLLEGLRLNFSDHRKDIPEIQRLLEDPVQRSRFLKIHAAGLHEVNEYFNAFTQYIKLAGPDTGELEREQIDSSLTVRNDLWVRSHISEIYRAAKNRERSKLDTELQKLLKKSLEKEGVDHLRKFIGTFDELPIVDIARLEMSKRLNSSDNMTEKILHLEKMQSSENSKIASYATATLAKLYLEIENAPLAIKQIAKTKKRFAEAVCFDKKTGSQLAKLWSKHPVVVADRNRETAWPNSRFVVETDPGKKNTSRGFTQLHSIQHQSPRSSIYHDWVFRIDTTGSSIIALDADGQEKWKVKVERQMLRYAAYGMSKVYTVNHLLVFSFATHFIVVDPYGDHKSPKSIWESSLIERSSGNNVSISTRRFGIGGRRRIQITTRDGKPLGKICLVTSRSVIYQIGTNLISADILTGDILWKRKNVQRESTIFGDEESLLLADKMSDSAKILNTFDGTERKTKKGRIAQEVSLPSKEKTILEYVGTKILVSEFRGNRTTISLFDPLASRNIWEKQYASKLQTSLVETDEIALLENSGTFHILKKATGKTVFSVPVKEGDDIDAIFVRRTDHRYLLMTHHTAKNNNLQILFSYTNYNDIAVNGNVYAFDSKSGKRLWKVRVENQLYSPYQPKNIPAIIFRNRYYENIVRGRIRNSRQQKSAIEILDERDGNRLFRGEFASSSSIISTHYQPEQKRLVVKVFRDEVRLVMTNKPFQPRSPEKTAKNSAPEKPGTNEDR